MKFMENKDDFSGRSGRYRHELKFLCTEEKMKEIELRIRHLCRLDAHVKEGGAYDIRSLYFDTLDDRYYHESKAGAGIRHKYRLRVYDQSQERIALERKSNLHGLRKKETEEVSLNQYEWLLVGKIPKEAWQTEGLLGEFGAEAASCLLRPKMIVGYRRTPYVYPVGNTRITFDRNLYASECKELFLKNIPKRNVLPQDMGILELKFDEVLPEVILNLVNAGHIF